MKNIFPAESKSRLGELLRNRRNTSLVTGELWMSSGFMKRLGLEDTATNHFAAAEMLGHEIVCLPVARTRRMDRVLGYRYFQPDDIKEEFKSCTECLGVVIDGPFQRMVGKHGLMEVLINWGRDRDEIQKNYDTEKQNALDLIRECLAAGVDLVVIADDFSGEQRPLIAPREIMDVCSPFYQQAVSIIHDAGNPVFLHCCGNLHDFLPLFSSWKLDGLAAIQTDKNDMDRLANEFGGVFMTGLEATLLEKQSVTEAEIKELHRLVRRFSEEGRLILSSSCGMYTDTFVDAVKKIYGTFGQKR